MSKISLDTQGTADLGKKAMRSLVGRSVTYCGGPYEVTEVNENKMELTLFSKKMNLQIKCDYDSPYLKTVCAEEETKKKEIIK
jgi:hypothetical protein